MPWHNDCCCFDKLKRDENQKSDQDAATISNYQLTTYNKYLFTGHGNGTTDGGKNKNREHKDRTSCIIK